MAHLVHLDRLYRRRISVLWFLTHPIDLVQQPLEHSMVTVDLVADLLILDDYYATLNDTILIGISELG